MVLAYNAILSQYARRAQVTMLYLARVIGEMSIYGARVIQINCMFF